MTFVPRLGCEVARWLWWNIIYKNPELHRAWREFFAGHLRFYWDAGGKWRRELQQRPKLSQKGVVARLLVEERLQALMDSLPLLTPEENVIERFEKGEILPLSFFGLDETDIRGPATGHTSEDIQHPSLRKAAETYEPRTS